MTPVNLATAPEATTNYREYTLAKAREHVVLERQDEYGTPEDNFNVIAELWDSYLSGLHHKIEATDVANMMILLKVARGMNNPSYQDNWEDIAGYAACGSECAHR